MPTRGDPDVRADPRPGSRVTRTDRSVRGPSAADAVRAAGRAQDQGVDRRPGLARGGDGRRRSRSTRMPVGQTVLSATEGAAFGFFPILWIVINAIWVYNLTVDDRALRRAAPLVRAGQPRPADPGHHHRVLLRRPARGAGRLRHAGRHHRGDADGAGLPPGAGRLGRADREHRAGGVRRARDPDRHAGRRDLRREQRRPADRRHPRRDGRAADAAPRARRAADPGDGGRRSPVVCGRPGRRRWWPVSPSASRSSSRPTTSPCR